MAFDGGAFDLATHDVWALCASADCRHPACHGILASIVDDPDRPEPAVFRVRNRRDLTRHLGSRDAATRVLVVPKGTLPGRPTADQIANPGPLARPADPNQIAATGTISVRQATRPDRFPLDTAAAATITRLVSGPISTWLGNPDTIRTRNRVHLEKLVTRYGIHHVERCVDEHLAADRNGRVAPLGLAVAMANGTLADRHHTGRLSRAYASPSDTAVQRTNDVATIIPNVHLHTLDPKPGQDVAGRLVAASGDDHTGHALLRVLDRVLGELPSSDVAASVTRRPINPDTRQAAARTRRDLPELLDDLLSEGVFSSSRTYAVLPEHFTRSLSQRNGPTGRSVHGKPTFQTDQVRVTCPHPRSADHVLVLLGTVGPVVRGSHGHQFTLTTVLVEERTGELRAELGERPEPSGGPGRVLRPVERLARLTGAADALTRPDEERLIRDLGLHTPAGGTRRTPTSGRR